MDVGTKARPRDWLAATILAAGLVLIFIPYAMGMMTVWTLSSGVFLAVIGAYEVPHIFSDTQVAEGAAAIATALATGAAIAEAQHKKALEEKQVSASPNQWRKSQSGLVVPPDIPNTENVATLAPRVQGGFVTASRAQADLAPAAPPKPVAQPRGKKVLDRHVASPYAPTSEHTSDDA